MAGVSTKDIKNRIRSMESTKQITKAMDMVAASKLRHAQAQVLNARPYFEILYATIADIAASGDASESPYLTRPDKGRVLYIVIAGDRGLAGGYNSNILKLVQSQIRGKTNLLTESYVDAANVSIGDCFSIAKLLTKTYLAEQFDRIYVAYTKFVSVLSQTPNTLQLLPLAQPEQTAGGQDILYEPDANTVFDAIIPEYLGGVLYGALCESRASEQAARRTAMDSATQNAEDMIANLSLKFNQARQAAITQEITEIVAGS